MTVSEIKKAMQRLANRKQAKLLQGFFKTGPGDYGEGDVFLGIKVPETRKVARQYHDAPMRVVRSLLHSRFHEERLLALLILVRQFEKGSPAERKQIYTFYLDKTAFVNNWDLVDLTAHHIVGDYLLERSRRPLYRLTRSKWLWDRRIAIVATARFIREHDFEDTLRIADILIADEHDLMHKAVGWMLREVGKRDRATEERFLKPRYRSMPRTMLRYAIERFPEPLRQGYLQGTV